MRSRENEIVEGLLTLKLGALTGPAGLTDPPASDIVPDVPLTMPVSAAGRPVVATGMQHSNWSPAHAPHGQQAAAVSQADLSVSDCH